LAQHGDNLIFRHSDAKFVELVCCGATGEQGRKQQDDGGKDIFHGLMVVDFRPRNSEVDLIAWRMPMRAGMLQVVIGKS